jgi:uncharacterized membrane protein
MGIPKDKKDKILSGLIIITGVALIIYAYATKGGLLNSNTLFGVAVSIYGIFLIMRNIGLGKKYSELNQRDKIITLIRRVLIILLIIMVIILFLTNSFRCIGQF